MKLFSFLCRKITLRTQATKTNLKYKCGINGIPEISIAENE